LKAILAATPFIAVTLASKFVNRDMPCERYNPVRHEDPGEPLVPVTDMPTDWVWSDIGGVNYLTNVFN